MSATVKRADGTVPRGGKHRLCRDAVPPGATRRSAAADTVQQGDAVGGADAAWLTVAHTTYLVGAAAATLESVTRSCVHTVASTSLTYLSTTIV